MGKKTEETLNELINWLDVPEEIAEGLKSGEKSVDDFSEFHQGKFITKEMALKDDDIHKAVLGHRMGSMTTTLQQAFSKSKADATDKDYDELLTEWVGELNTKITDLEKGGDASENEQIQILTNERDSFKKKLEETNELFENTKGNFDQFKKESDGRFAQFKIDKEFNDSFAKVKFRDDIKDLEKLGFVTELKSKYDIDIETDEGGKESFTITHNGNKIKNSKGDGHLNMKEVFEKDAADNKLLQLNNVTDKPKLTPTNGDPPPERKGRLIHTGLNRNIKT